MNELSLIDSLFNPMFDQMSDFTPHFNYNVPKVDVKESKDGYTLEMDLPGRSEKDVNLELDHNTLTISSEKEETKEEKSPKKDEAKWLIRERRVNQFSRRFTLPDDVNGTDIKASFKNGVLSVVLPRKAIAAPKRIAIESIA